MKKPAYTLASQPNSQTTPICHSHIPSKERNRHEHQSIKPRTYQKGVPTCRGIKERCCRRGGDTLPKLLSLPRGTQGIKQSLHANDLGNGKRQTLLCGTGKICTPPHSTPTSRACKPSHVFFLRANKQHTRT